MAYQVLNLSCPKCGLPVSIGMKECEAGHALDISTFNSVYSMPLPMVNKYADLYRKVLKETPDDTEINNSLAFCYLKLKLYDKALLSFEKAIEDNFDNSETYFYAAICLLQGKKAFLQQRPTIDKILEYIITFNVLASYKRTSSLCGSQNSLCVISMILLISIAKATPRVTLYTSIL